MQKKLRSHHMASQGASIYWEGHAPRLP